MILDFEAKQRELEAHFAGLESKLASPDATKDRKAYAELSRRHRELSEVVRAFRERERLARQLAQAEEMRRDKDPEIAGMAEAETEEARVKLEAADLAIQVLLLPSDPRDARNTIMEIRAGTGGDEAGLFVADLFRLYKAYGERRGWKAELISVNETNLGGFKEIIFLIAGERVYSRFKHEAGTHRVQRVPVMETQGRIHTSTVTVAVMPEAEEIDIDIKEHELRIDVFRSGGHGGQSVNTTDSAVRITHLPSGLVVSQQDERSQIKNRAKAMKVLRARLYDMEERRRHEESSAERKQQVGTGERAEKIRTYNYPQNRLTDHRIGLTLYNLDRIMEGDLDPVIDPLITHYQTEALKSL